MRLRVWGGVCWRKGLFCWEYKGLIFGFLGGWVLGFHEVIGVGGVGHDFEGFGIDGAFVILGNGFGRRGDAFGIRRWGFGDFWLRCTETHFLRKKIICFVQTMVRKLF
jgi:hypothetical protein